MEESGTNLFTKIPAEQCKNPAWEPSAQEKWYLLLTCSPEKDGKMEVEMSAYGDKVLLMFLLENAQERLSKGLYTDKAL